MEYEKIYASKKLMEVAEGLIAESAAIKMDWKNDDAINQEHKIATKRALQHAIDKIHQKVAELNDEYKK